MTIFKNLLVFVILTAAIACSSSKSKENMDKEAATKESKMADSMMNRCDKANPISLKDIKERE